MKKIFDDFKNFAFKGNVVDMAVGVVIGMAFGKIISSLVADIIMPPISLLLDKINLTNLFYVMRPESEGVSAIVINYGNFINTLLDFILIALAVFFMVKLIAKATDSMKKTEEEAPKPETEKDCVKCFSKIHLEASKCKFCTADI